MALSLALVSLQYSAILLKVVMPNTIASAKIGDDAASAVEQRVLGLCCSHKGGVRRREARGGEAHHGGLRAGVRRQGGGVRVAVVRPPRTAGRRKAQVDLRVLTRTPVWPTHITNGFFSWRFAAPVSCNAARRGKLTAGGITSHVALYDTCGIMEMNSAQNTKRTRGAPMPSTSSNN